MAAPTKKVKKKNIKLASGLLYVTTTSNNTHITLTDAQGNKISG
jgi:ribosomal protein S11